MAHSSLAGRPNKWQEMAQVLAQKKLVDVSLLPQFVLTQLLSTGKATFDLYVGKEQRGEIGMRGDFNEVYSDSTVYECMLQDKAR